ncbi:MAG: tetratricopeptide repeat protein [Treponema sp.]|jgi:TolA-binding protein|nr:tetratricopeptide repeat protein [Treponema sp.]
MNKKAVLLPFFCLFLLIFQEEPALSQTKPPDRTAKAAAPGFNRLQSGLSLYQEGRWREAIGELRRAQAEAVDPELKGEAYYWISLAELSSGNYRGAIRDMDAVETTAPESKRLREIPYHRGRALYHLGRYDEALIFLKLYTDRIGGTEPLPPGSSAAARKSAALYWIGECLYAMGQLDYARDIFMMVTTGYPGSAKYEASSYRLGLINQKKIEEELLALLKWSHEESLRAIEEYQRRERSYDQALIAYQKRIAELLKDTHIPDLEAANAQYRRQLQEAEARIRALESDSGSPPPPVGAVPPAPLSQAEKDRRLLSLRAAAAELSDEMLRLLNESNQEGIR